MIYISSLVDVAENYRVAVGGVPETTVSHRVFGDSKRLTALRDGKEITVGRFNAAMLWFAENWPPETERPEALLRFVTPHPPQEAAVYAKASIEDGARLASVMTGALK